MLNIAYFSCLQVCHKVLRAPKGGMEKREEPQECH